MIQKRTLGKKLLESLVITALVSVAVLAIIGLCQLLLWLTARAPFIVWFPLIVGGCVGLMYLISCDTYV